MKYRAHYTGLPTNEYPRQLLVCLSIWIFLLIGGTLLLGCDSNANARAKRLFDLHLRVSDLPSGWQRVSGGIGVRDQEDKGIISRSVSFVGVPEQQVPGVLVKHELIDYPSITEAANAYTEITTALFPTEDWTWPEQVGLNSQADQFRVACRAASPENSHCSSVAQYGNLISVIHANVFQDKWLTIKDLERLLEAVDARIAAAGGEL